MTITIKDKESGKPLEGVRIERYEGASSMEKIVNPIGSTYHPFTFAECVFTGTDGQAHFRKSSVRDKFQIYSTNARTLLVIVWEKEVTLSPDTSQTVSTNWGYSVRLEEGKVNHSVWPIKE